MSLPSVSLVEVITPDRKLEKTLVCRYYPTSSMREEILNGLREHLKCDLDQYIIDLRIEVNLNLYKDKIIEDKKYWYEDKIKPNNDTKNT